jgi:hypothetical protein
MQCYYLRSGYVSPYRHSSTTTTVIADLIRNLWYEDALTALQAIGTHERTSIIANN